MPDFYPGGIVFERGTGARGFVLDSIDRDTSNPEAEMRVCYTSGDRPIYRHVRVSNWEMAPRSRYDRLLEPDGPDGCWHGVRPKWFLWQGPQGFYPINVTSDLPLQKVAGKGDFWAFRAPRGFFRVKTLCKKSVYRIGYVRLIEPNYYAVWPVGPQATPGAKWKSWVTRALSRVGVKTVPYAYHLESAL
jgi:hypothetical protein